MSEYKKNEIYEYLYKKINLVVDNVFEELKKNNINVELDRKELGDKELKIYLDIYIRYEKELIQLKKEVIEKFGEIENFDYIYAIIIQNVVNKKQEL